MSQSGLVIHVTHVVGLYVLCTRVLQFYHNVRVNDDDDDDADEAVCLPSIHSAVLKHCYQSSN